jgi:hypothetical protein
MSDEMIASPAQNSGGVRAAAVFLSAHVLQRLLRCPPDLHDEEYGNAAFRTTRRLPTNCFMFKIIWGLIAL